MSGAAAGLLRAMAVSNVAEAIGCDAETVEFWRGVALAYAIGIIAAGVE